MLLPKLKTTMNELLACRICLATNTKLFNIFRCNLVASYEVVSRSMINQFDGLPQYVCTICCKLLTKYAEFNNLCEFSNNLLHRELQEKRYLTTYNIESLRPNCNILNLTVSPQASVEFIEIKNEVFDNFVTESLMEMTAEELDKEDSIDNIDAIDNVDNVKIEDDSDEEPLSKKTKPKIENYSIADKDIGQKRNSYKLLSDLDIKIIMFDEEEQRMEMEKRKTSTKYLNSIFKCESCYKGFLSNKTYRNHMMLHEPSAGEHECALCKARFKEPRTLRAHALNAHQRIYKCLKCHFIAKTNHSAREHYEWHQGRLFVCNTCGASFKKSTTYYSHLRIRHGSRVHMCALCGDSFVGRKGLQRHRAISHRDTQVDEDLRNQKQGEVPTKRECDGCKVRFATKEALGLHTFLTNKQCDDSTNWCVHCGEGFPTEETLQQHLKGHQQPRNITFPCDHCSRQFSSASARRAHRARDHDQHHGSFLRKNTVCEVCGRIFKENHQLIVHLRTHTGEKPFQCTKCQKRFSVKQALKIHTRTHTGERPFPCTNCTKAFKHKAALNRHMKVHTGSKPYTCSHCGKSFSQSNSMKLHVSTVHLRLPAPYRKRPHRR